MNKQVATVDLGTNTFHLLIAELNSENSFHLVHRERIPVMIGRGGINQGVISEDAQQRALEALSHFKQQLDTFGVPLENVHCTATSAIRNAKNGQELVNAIFEQTGIRVDIISGDKEAEYIYYGVRHAVPLGSDSALIMDIGGGSVEFIICNDHQIYWKHSFEIGAQRLLDRFDIQDPITPANINELKEYFGQTLTPLSEKVKEYQPRSLIGASGTFDTLSEIHVMESQLNVDPEATELPLSHDAFKRMLTTFSNKTREERLQIPGMIEMRVDMIVVASWLIDYVLETFNLREIRISSFALKEGLLVKLANQIH
jgi:exopolyphosphatase/guanosine-5'-triphosphate,3'-diphosphate pyrophosphatase